VFEKKLQQQSENLMSTLNIHCHVIISNDTMMWFQICSCVLTLKHGNEVEEFREIRYQLGRNRATSSAADY